MMQSRDRFLLSLFLLSGAACGAETGSQTAEISKSTDEKSSALYVKDYALWWSSATDGEVPISVCWEQDGYSQEKNWVRDAVSTTWGWYSKIDFLYWDRCSGYYDVKIKISDEVSHTNGLGTEIQNENHGMVLNFTFNNWGQSCKYSRESCIRASAVHEFGHALGFAHEQNRPDTPASCDQEQGSDGNVTFGDWDLSSVMNYCNPSWNNGGRLSDTDIAGVEHYYGTNPLWASKVLDTVFYLNHYGDLKAYYGNDNEGARNHFVQFGINEGRRGSREFDVSYYLDAYGDLKAAFGADRQAALNHWMTYGIREGRRSSREFDVSYYVNHYGDLKAAFGADYQAALDHWVRFGLSEGRRGSQDFDVQFYLNYYPDLKAAFGTNYQAAFDHWVNLGSQEGRKGVP